MSFSNADNLPHGEAVRRSLSRIADALNIPVVTLYDSALIPDEIAGAGELLSLYLSLKNEPARARVLVAARAAVAAQSD